MKRVLGRGMPAWLAGMVLSAAGPGLAWAQGPADEPAAETATETTGAEPAPDTAAVGVVPVVPDEPAPEPASRNATMLDTIEVTASKRAKSQRDLPGSVGALRGEELEKIRAQGMEDYLKLIPGVSLTDFGTSQQIPVIRGIASSTDELGLHFTGLPTGIYLDDMPFSDLFAPLSVPDLNPFDLERVEVLKGPQGTLFGSGALAGAIRYIVQKPNLGVWQGKLSTTLTRTRHAGDASHTTAAALNVPLGNDAAVRVVGLLRNDAGFYDARPNGGNTRNDDDINQTDQFTGRALARWDVGDRLKLSGFYFAQDTDRSDGGSANQDRTPERNDVPFASPLETGFSGGNLGATYDLDWARLLYTGNLLRKDTYSLGHLEQSLPNQLGNQQDTAWYTLVIGDVEGFTHELRISSPEGGGGDWEWLAGAAFLNYKQGFFQFTPNPGPADQGYYANPPDGPEDVSEADRISSFLWATVEGDGTEAAVFGEVTRRLGEHWEATLGARSFKTKLISDTVLTDAQIVALGEPGQTESRKHYVAAETGFNPKAALRYVHDRNIQAYALASKGFQFGGFQLNPPIANVEQAAEDRGFKFGPFKSSTLWNYEIGLRTEWLDRRLRFDLAAFYLDWTDLQLTLQVPVNAVPIPAPPGSGIPENVPIDVIVNVGRAHSEGVEAVLAVAPFSGATVTSSAAWISARTDEAFDEEHPDGPVPAGTRLPGSPRFQWANVVSYENTLPYFSAWSGAVTLTHSHVGESPNSIRATRDVGGYDTLDARIDLAMSGTTWVPEVSLGVNNLLDVRGVAAYSGDGDAVNAFYFVRPRTTLLSLAWRY